MPPPPDGQLVALRDGRTVLVRPVYPGDFDRLQRGVQEMSRSSRYMRFFSFAEGLTDEQARYFTRIDQVGHVAWCAVEPSEVQRGYGLARFVRVSPDSSIANFAVAVIDEMQGCGLGLLLLAAIYLRAGQLGVRTLQGEMLPDNPVMPTLMPKLGGRILFTGDPTCRMIDWPVRRPEFDRDADVEAGDEEVLPADTNTARQFLAYLKVLAPLLESHAVALPRPE